MGERTIAAHKYGLEELGINIETKENDYVISSEKIKGGDIVMYEAGDTAIINVLLAAALIGGETTVSFASSNYQVQEVCVFLQKLGVRIDGIGTHNLKIRGKNKRRLRIHFGRGPN
jgi:UDP-N-acetylglucosamine 1-carboxyvinyltransferase